MTTRNASFRTAIGAFGRTLSGNRWVQAGLLLAFWLAGEGVVRVLSLPFPGGLVGLVLVLLLLLSGRLRLSRIERGAQCLLSDMLLFFVPAVLAILDHRAFLSLTGLKILAVIVLSTATVMIATALAIDLCYRWASRDEHGNAVAE
ncbi:CidA/LrgA family protein [Pseudochelatococcus sp. B33]